VGGERGEEKVDQSDKERRGNVRVRKMSREFDTLIVCQCVKMEVEASARVGVRAHVAWAGKDERGEETPDNKRLMLQNDAVLAPRQRVGFVGG